MQISCRFDWMVGVNASKKKKKEIIIYFVSWNKFTQTHSQYKLMKDKTQLSQFVQSCWSHTVFDKDASLLHVYSFHFISCFFFVYKIYALVFPFETFFVKYLQKDNLGSFISL